MKKEAGGPRAQEGGKETWFETKGGALASRQWAEPTKAPLRQHVADPNLNLESVEQDSHRVEMMLTNAKLRS